MGTDADQRYYAVGAGRFNSPDPLGIAGANPKNPTSWNRYTYVHGDPVNFNDPTGRLSCTLDGVSIGCDVVLPECGFSDGNGFIQVGGPSYCQESGPIDGGGGGGYEEPPRIPCEIDAGTIDNYIANTPIYGDPKLSKPLAGMGQAFIDAALQYDTNPAVLVAIAFQESHWGYDQLNKGTNNAFGLLHADGSFLTFDTWQQGISSASKTVDSLYSGGNRSVSDLYSGLPGAYCTHNGCSDGIKNIEKRVRALGEDPNYLGFDCEMKDGVLVKRQ